MSDLIKIMYEDKIDEYLKKNPNETREIFLPYQLKHEKMIDAILISWQQLKQHKTQKTHQYIGFTNLFKCAEIQKKHPVLLFKELKTNEKINIYNNFLL